MTDSVQAEHRRTISGHLDADIDAIQCQRLAGWMRAHTQSAGLAATANRICGRSAIF
jgi:hypothetical protein